MIKIQSILRFGFLFLPVLFIGCASIESNTPTRENFNDSCGLDSCSTKANPPKAQPPKTHYQAALAELKAGNMDKASIKVKLALQENPLDAPSHFLLGCLLEYKGEHDQAIVAFQRSVALDPGNPDALYNLGTMLLWRGELLPASRMLENAVLIRPDHVPSHNNLGKTYFLTGLPELAVAAYEESLRLDPSNVIALHNLLVLAGAAGNREEAAAYRQRIQALEAGSAIPDLDAELPTWPLVTAAVGSPSPTPLPVIETLKPLAAPDKEADELRELLRDLPYVTVERRAGRLTLAGYTSGPKERKMLDSIIEELEEVLDLTNDDIGDTQRLIEFDAVLFILTGLDQSDVGFNFLRLIDLNFNYFASDNKRAGTGYTAPPSDPARFAATGAVNGMAQNGWIFTAAASYSVNIANASDEKVAVLARPHLTALSGTSADFLAGGEIVYRTTGNIGGDIKPYPFGTKLKVSPTLLRTPAEDGTPRVHVKVTAGRLSVLTILQQNEDAPSVYTKVEVNSEAVLKLGETLVLSGLSQRESHEGLSGVPFLRDIPIIKYFFSTRRTMVSDTAVIILLTPRDAAFMDEKNRKELGEFVTMRRAFITAKHGTEEDMRRFREQYPDWQHLAPSRYASHLYMLENSEIYRSMTGQHLTSEDVGLELLGPKPNL